MGAGAVNPRSPEAQQNSATSNLNSTSLPTRANQKRSANAMYCEACSTEFSLFTRKVSCVLMPFQFVSAFTLVLSVCVLYQLIYAVFTALSNKAKLILLLLNHKGKENHQTYDRGTLCMLMSHVITAHPLLCVDRGCVQTAAGCTAAIVLSKSSGVQVLDDAAKNVAFLPQEPSHARTSWI